MKRKKSNDTPTNETISHSILQMNYCSLIKYQRILVCVNTYISSLPNLYHFESNLLKYVMIFVLSSTIQQPFPIGSTKPHTWPRLTDDPVQSHFTWYMSPDHWPLGGPCGKHPTGSTMAKAISQGHHNGEIWVPRHFCFVARYWQNMTM